MSKKVFILVVEDYPELQYLIRHILESEGHHVLMAATGEQGLELLRRHSDVSAVILDNSLPDMNAKAFLDLVLQENLCREKSIILCSASPPVCVGDFLTLIAGFIQKPFDIGSFLQEIRKVIQAPTCQSVSKNVT